MQTSIILAILEFHKFPVILHSAVKRTFVFHTKNTLACLLLLISSSIFLGAGRSVSLVVRKSIVKLSEIWRHDGRFEAPAAKSRR